MTNKEAIKILKTIREDYEGDGEVLDEGKDALDLAIKALETLDCCTYFKQNACGKCLHYEEAENENEQTTD